MPIRSQMSSNMGQIGAEHPELFALVFGKITEYDFVYTLASTNINQTAPNLVRMHATIRSWMSSIMDLIRPELPELSALELENLPYLTCLHSSICKYQPISTKLGHNIYSHKVSDDFDYGAHPELIAFEFGKIAESDFVYNLASININPFPNDKFYTLPD